jgi:hypothetical protein
VWTNPSHETRPPSFLLRVCGLYGFDPGKQVWPPVVPHDMSLFDPQLYADPRYSADWWKFRQQDAAYAKAEGQRVNGHYAQQARERGPPSLAGGVVRQQTARGHVSPAAREKSSRHSRCTSRVRDGRLVRLESTDD